MRVRRATAPETSDPEKRIALEIRKGANIRKKNNQLKVVVTVPATDMGWRR